MKQKLRVCCLKKSDYSKVEECNVIKQLLNAAYRYVHVSPPHTHKHMHTCTHTTVLPFLCPHHTNQSHIASTGVLKSPQPDQEGNKLQRHKILIFIYPTYNHNWRNISTIYTWTTRPASNGIFSPSNKIHQEVGRAKELSAPQYMVL